MSLLPAEGLDYRFYHLTTTPLHRALPPLLQRALQAGMTCQLLHNQQEQLARFDSWLWEYDADSFLPHALSHGEADDARQPILLAQEFVPAQQAQLLMLTDGRPLPELTSTVSRVFDLFDAAEDDALQAARQRWKSCKAAGFTVTYYRQQELGGWKQEA